LNRNRRNKEGSPDFETGAENGENGHIHQRKRRAGQSNRMQRTEWKKKEKPEFNRSERSCSLSCKMLFHKSYSLS
jgi:hypothetical protein